MRTNYLPYLSDRHTVYTTARQVRSSSDSFVIRYWSVLTVSHGNNSSRIPHLSTGNYISQQLHYSDCISIFRSETKTHISYLHINTLNLPVIIMLH